jgi:uncharacterized protein DUF6228
MRTPAGPVAIGRDGAKLLLGPCEGTPATFHYAAALVGVSLSGRVEVHDLDAKDLVAFFRDLAEHWRGWDGTKAFRSLEGHLTLEAERDRLGHVRLHVVLREDALGDWSITGVLAIDSGELEAVAHSVAVELGPVG